MLSNEWQERKIIKDIRILKTLSKKGFFKFPVDIGHSYIDEENNPRQFKYKNQLYRIDYISGCFFPFLFKIIERG